MYTPTRNQAHIALRLLYPIWAVVGIAALLYVPSQILVGGDATATAENLVARPLLNAFGFTLAQVTQLLFIVTVLLLYVLFEGVDRRTGAVMVVLALVSVPIAMLAPLGRILAAGTAATDPEFSLFLLGTEAEATKIAELFWGLWLFPLGALVNRSGWFPKVIGYALHVGGVGYFAGFFAHVLLPSGHIAVAALSALTLGEMVFIFWLVIVGARLPKS